MKDLRFIHNKKLDLPKYLDSQEPLNNFHEKGEKYNEKYKEVRENKSAFDIFFKQKNSNKWKIFKDDFLILSGSRCPICEHDISNYDDIEHFRPKNYYWWLAYDYINYAPYCKLCNSTYKRDNFPLNNPSKKVNFTKINKINQEKPLLFNPLKDNLFELFQIKLETQLSGKGILKIEPLDSLHKNSYKYKKAKKTIELYNLNNEQKKDITRKNRMENKYGDLISLVEKHIEFITNPNDIRIELEFFKILTNIRINKKLGIAEFIVKKQYIDLTI